MSLSEHGAGRLLGCKEVASRPTGAPVSTCSQLQWRQRWLQLASTLRRCKEEPSTPSSGVPIPRADALGTHCLTFDLSSSRETGP